MPSSVIDSLSYDPSTQVLRVVFLSGAVYEYLGVPEKTWLDMKAFRSKGRYLNNRIKGHFRFKKVTPEPETRGGS